MSDVAIELKYNILNNVYIDGNKLTLVRNAIVNFNWPGMPILKVERYKPDMEGYPYTITGEHAATLTEYYPVHQLTLIEV
jgi:hypothetical protein